MFTYVYLKNFKSFGEIRFDFKKTKSETKKFVAIYGENGSGKSNFVSVFELLFFTINYFKFKEMLSLTFGDIQRAANQFSYSNMNSIFTMIRTKLSNYRMIGCDEATTIEIGFSEKGTDGYYRFVFKDEVIAEELYYLCGKKRGIMFSINAEENSRVISKNLFSAEYKKEFEQELDKYWGKGTFLGVLVKELDAKNRSYIENNISNNLLDAYLVLNSFFAEFSYDAELVKFGGIDFRNNSYKHDIPFGKRLAQKEKVLNALFCELYSDIKEIYYDKRLPEDGSLPPLHVKKVIAGEIRDVLFYYESSGTRRILELVDAIVAVMNGTTVICDEIDTGIHDLLMNSIITSLVANAPGQLIITTHNTLLLESIDPQYAYVIYVDCDGNKEARCFADYGGRIQKTNNARNLYLKGVYGGIPYTSEIDFSFLSNNESDGEVSGE